MPKSPIARKTDPSTPHLAAEEVNATGLRDAQICQVADAVAAHPCFTSRELAQITGIDRYVLGRRLSDAERKQWVKAGPIRRCSIAKRDALTWIPV